MKMADVSQKKKDQIESKFQPNCYDLMTRVFHWGSVMAMLGAYITVYIVIFFMDLRDPDARAVLNMHWVLGVFIGCIFLPRILWQKFARKLSAPLGQSKRDYFAAKLVHLLLYASLILMPLTGYLGTGAPTQLGFVTIPSFKNTVFFQWISENWQITFKQFEVPLDIFHHFVGSKLLPFILFLHIGAALYHHFILRDQVLVRMLPKFKRSKD